MKIKKKQRKALLIALPVLILIAAIYLIGMMVFTTRFLPRTIVNGIDVSFKGLEEANAAIADISPMIKVRQKTTDGNTIEEEIDLKRLDQSIVYNASDLLVEQDVPLWFTSFFYEKQLSADRITGPAYDPSRVPELIKDLYCLKEENTIESKEPQIVYENGEVSITPAVEGCQISKDKVISIIDKALSDLFASGRSTLIDLTRDYDVPTMKKDDPILLSKIDSIKMAFNKTITIPVTASSSETISADQLKDLLKVENNELTVNDAALDDYILELAGNYDSEYEYLDRATLKQDLTAALTSSDDATVNVSWISEKKGFIEVDISDQMMYYYENDVLLLSSPVVTSNDEIEDGTPRGHFQIRRMKEDSTLVGADYTEHVDYWIGFDETGRIFGFHDAQWRDAFGGDIYLTDPSHGCVNMPLDKIAHLYQYVDIGTEVYIHD